jgi:peroxin-14
LLKDVHAETVAVRTAVEHQNARIDEANQEVEAFIKETRESEVKFRDEMREIREEISSVRDMLPKVFSLTNG